MTYLTSKKFSFTSKALPVDTFGVISLEGKEGISKCYAFDILLISDNKEIDLKGVINSPAAITFHRDEGEDVTYNGILLSFEQLQEVSTCAIYRAHLVPRLLWLSFTYHNQVFLDKTIPEIIEACLKDGGLTQMDFDIRVNGSYEPIDYVCQYGESHLAFISRWCEREGIYYYFEQTDTHEKVIFTDTKIAHTPSPKGSTLFYSPPSGLEAFHEKEVVRSFTCTYNLTPSSILIKDYNYMKPSLDITGTADIDENGRGKIYYYGDHIKTPEEGNRLAKIRAESIKCRQEIFKGESSVPSILPGFTFVLKDHYRPDFNKTYLVTEVYHHGDQTGYLISGLNIGTRENPFYRNPFHAISSDIQYRPERLTPKPRISGTISAKIDAAGSGQYAELDEHGRYKIILPFDISGRRNGKASTWIRMATPYIGSDHGMHFPLHKDTEVLLTFIDGDPDQPVIAASVPNPENPSPVSSVNSTKSIITTASGNKIHIEDQAG
ncbi:MAG: type VI secretion system tip protein VgrG, partial [Syntrophorhabdaceae bacterium]|nr:type VI secretion system tip protein VgrG [Syntrophorhabdaceae bacterium]